MDHETAVSTLALERYYLKELGEAEREALEDHVAECPACLECLRDLTIFAANARTVFDELVISQPVGPKSGWLDRLHVHWVPALALSVAVNLVLIAGFSYQGARIASFTSPHFVTQLAASVAERGDADVSRVRQSEISIIVTFDAPRHREESYPYELSTAGSVVQRGVLSPPPGTEETWVLEFPTVGLRRGRYTLQLFSTNDKSVTVGRVTFEKT